MKISFRKPSTVKRALEEIFSANTVDTAKQNSFRMIMNTIKLVLIKMVLHEVLFST